MQRILSLLAFSAVFSMLALADSWSGRLIDATCFNQQKKTDGCDAMSTTTAFALDVSGKVYKFDAAGNSKASTSLKSRADRAADPNKPQSSQVMAKVDGTEKSGMIAVENIDVQ